MSKMGNFITELQESDDYRFGWESAERGEPRPVWSGGTVDDGKRLVAQKLGWDGFRNQESSK